MLFRKGSLVLAAFVLGMAFMASAAFGAKKPIINFLL